MHERLLLYLLRGRDGVFGGLLVLSLPRHLLATADQRVEVDVPGGVHVELGGLAVLEKDKGILSPLTRFRQGLVKTYERNVAYVGEKRLTCTEYLIQLLVPFFQVNLKTGLTFPSSLRNSVCTRI